MRTAIVVLVLTLAGEAAAQVPFFDAAVGLGDARETPPALVDPSPALAGHIVIGERFGRHAAIGVTASLFHATFDNTFEPPVTTVPDERMPVTRGGIGLGASGILPLGPFELSAGAAAYVFRVKATASGASPLLPAPGEYASASDTGPGFELSVGAAASPWPCGRGGVRVIWTRHRAELPEEVDLGGLAIELFVQVDLMGAPTQAGGSRTRC